MTEQIGKTMWAWFTHAAPALVLLDQWSTGILPSHIISVTMADPEAEESDLIINIMGNTRVYTVAEQTADYARLRAELIAEGA